ncbi:MAG: hypothetical protein MR291_11105 [Oscillospiraceae bacterium]|nr:hypothetical protein [Oscillospiraceae bacterium]
MITIAAAALLLTGVTAGAESAGFSGDRKYISAAAAPYSNKYTQIQWGGDVQRKDCGTPLAYGDKLLLPTESSLIALRENTGETVTSVALLEDCSVEYSGALLGDTLLQPTRSGVALINAKDMTVKAFRGFDGAIAADCAIIDDLGYTAIQVSGGYEFLCIDLSSDDLETVWSITLSDKPTAPAVQGDNIVFAAGSSILTHNFKSGEVTEIPLEKQIATAPFATEYAVFFCTTDGYAGKLRLDPDGTLEEDTLTLCRIGGKPSSPVSWNGRLYISTEDGFYILDNLNMEVSYIISDIKSGCTPQIHYGSGPYIYTVSRYEDKWAVYCILDSDSDAEPTSSVLALMDSFENGSFCASPNGSLYFLDDIGRTYALTAVPYNVWALVIRLVVLLALLALVFIWIRKVAKRRENLRPKY